MAIRRQAIEDSIRALEMAGERLKTQEAEIPEEHARAAAAISKGIRSLTAKLEAMKKADAKTLRGPIATVRKTLETMRRQAESLAREGVEVTVDEVTSVVLATDRAKFIRSFSYTDDPSAAEWEKVGFAYGQLSLVLRKQGGGEDIRYLGILVACGMPMGGDGGSDSPLPLTVFRTSTTGFIPRESKSFSELYEALFGTKAGDAVGRKITKDEFEKWLSGAGLAAPSKSLAPHVSSVEALSARYLPAGCSDVSAGDGEIKVRASRSYEIEALGRADQMTPEVGKRPLPSAEALAAAAKQLGAAAKVTAHAGFEEIDYYDGCDGYHIPCYTLKDGVVEDRGRISNTTPKAWEYMAAVDIVLNPAAMRPEKEACLKRLFEAAGELLTVSFGGRGRWR